MPSKRLKAMAMMCKDTVTSATTTVTLYNKLIGTYLLFLLTISNIAEETINQMTKEIQQQRKHKKIS